MQNIELNITQTQTYGMSDGLYFLPRLGHFGVDFGKLLDWDTWQEYEFIL